MVFSFKALVFALSKPQVNYNRIQILCDKVVYLPQVVNSPMTAVVTSMAEICFNISHIYSEMPSRAKQF
jgi:hypothetical protein